MALFRRRPAEAPAPPARSAPAKPAAPSLHWAFRRLGRDDFYDVPPVDFATVDGGDRIAGWVKELAKLDRDELPGGRFCFMGRNLLAISHDAQWTECQVFAAADAAKFAVFAVEADQVSHLTADDFATLPQPSIVLMKHGAWCDRASDSDSDAAERHDATCRLLSERDLDARIAIVTVVESIHSVAQELRAMGGFDRFIEVPTRSDAEWGRLLLHRLEDRAGKSLRESATLAGALFHREFETERRKELALLAMMRRSYLKGPYEFVHLVELRARGLVEGHRALHPALRKSSAVHESGHAVVAMVEEDGPELPEYVSIIPTANWSGVMVHEAERMVADDREFTYGLSRRYTKIWLAGRAAEELYYGPAGISNGCQDDLDIVTTRTREMFARDGFALRMDEPGRSGSNLAVLTAEPSEWPPEERARIDTMVREFLAEQYAETLALLTQHRALLDDVVAELLERDVLGREDFRRVGARHGLTLPVRTTRAA